MARLNRKRVEEIFTMSKQEKWAYPKIFEALVFLEEIAHAGVVRYRVDMSAREVSYFGAAGQAYVEKVPPF